MNIDLSFRPCLYSGCFRYCDRGFRYCDRDGTAIVTGARQFCYYHRFDWQRSPEGKRAAAIHDAVVKQLAVTPEAFKLLRRTARDARLLSIMAEWAERVRCELLNHEGKP